MATGLRDRTWKRALRQEWPTKQRYSPIRNITCSEDSETGGILFRECCFGGENSLSLIEFWGKLGEFCEKLGEFALAHK